MQKYISQHYKVWGRALIEKDDPRLPIKRKVSSFYEKGGAPVKFVSKVEEYYRHFFFIKQLIWPIFILICICNRFQQKNYSETLQVREIMLLKALREGNFGHKLQQMPSFFSSNQDQFKLDPTENFYTYCWLKKSWNKELMIKINDEKLIHH